MGTPDFRRYSCVFSLDSSGRSKTSFATGYAGPGGRPPIQDGKWQRGPRRLVAEVEVPMSGEKTASTRDGDRPKEWLYIAGQDVPAATQLVLLQNELLVIFPTIMEDPTIVARLQALGIHQRLVCLSLHLLAEFERRVALAPGGLQVALDDLATDRPPREEA
jgi:hypothetical protein